MAVLSLSGKLADITYSPRYAYSQPSDHPRSPIGHVSQLSLQSQKLYWYGLTSMLQGHARVYLKPKCNIEGNLVC